MRLKSKIYRFLLVVVSLLIVEALTFYTISPTQLESKLLPHEFQMSHDSDSAYVIPFYTTDCGVAGPTVLSHDLQSRQDILKEKLRVKFICFDGEGDNQAPERSAFNLVYQTWMERADWITLSCFFKMQQVEVLIVDRSTIYERRVTYQWCLFFWMKSFEFVSRDGLRLMDRRDSD